MISSDKKRVLVYFTEKDLKQIDKQAKKENRSRVNYIVNSVLTYTESKSNKLDN